MGVLGRRTHWERSLALWSNRRAVKFPGVEREHELCLQTSRKFQFSSENALVGEDLYPYLEANRHWIRERARGQFCPTVVANIRCGFVLSLCLEAEDNFVHATTAVRHIERTLASVRPNPTDTPIARARVQ